MTERRSAHFRSLGVEGHFTCMEVVTIDESKTELWCGCDNNTIITLSLKSVLMKTTPKDHQTIKNVSGSAHGRVLQLKMVKCLNLQLVYTLLDTGTVVCYDAVLKDCLKRIPTSTGKHCNLCTSMHLCLYIELYNAS